MKRRTALPFNFKADASLLAVVAALLSACFGSASLAEEPVVETVLTDLRGPCSIAIRPNPADAGAYEVLVYESGAGRVVAVRSNDPEKSATVISGLVSDGNRGALLVLDANLVAVSGRKGLLEIYSLPALAESTPTDEPVQTIETATEIDSSESRVVALARSRANQRVPDVLIFAVTGEKQAGRLLQLPIRADTFGDVTQFRSESTDDPRAIAALTISPQGFVVAAHNADAPDRSQLTFYNPRDGSNVLNLAVDLVGIAGLAYSPISGHLYAAAVATETDKAGVYRIDDASRTGKPACVAVKIAEIIRTTSLTFAPDGSLYVTTTGAQTDGTQGTLQRISGDL